MPKFTARRLKMVWIPFQCVLEGILPECHLPYENDWCLLMVKKAPAEIISGRLAKI